MDQFLIFPKGVYSQVSQLYIVLLGGYCTVGFSPSSPEIAVGLLITHCTMWHSVKRELKKQFLLWKNMHPIFHGTANGIKENQEASVKQN